MMDLVARHGARIAAVGLLAAALIGLWQALKLDSWGFDGPGAGFFPQLVAGVSVALALLVVLLPGKAAATEEGDTEVLDAAAIAASRRTFLIYGIAFLALALFATYAGFALTTLAVSIIIVRFAEGRSWFAAIGYGVICAAIGLVCFGWLLRVDLPESYIERFFFSLVR